MMLLKQELEIRDNSIDKIKVAINTLADSFEDCL